MIGFFTFAKKLGFTLFAIAIVAAGVCSFVTKAEAAIEFAVDTRPAMPFFHADRQHYRLGLANNFGSTFLAYAGNRVFFLRSTPNTDRGDRPEMRYKLGVAGGILLSLKSAGSFTFDLMTQDGYFGLIFESASQRGGWGIELMHHSAHLADGATARGWTPVVFNQNYLTFKGFYLIHRLIPAEVKAHVFLKDSPAKMRTRIDFNLILDAFNMFRIYAGARIVPQGTDIEYIRIKVTYGNPQAHPKFVPYLLFHHGYDYRGQIAARDAKSTQWLFGIEVDI